jgi:hypothetical protein
MRKIFSISLLIVYLALLTIPYVPYIQYYVSNKYFHNNNCSISIDSSKTIVGDMCYLNALIERTKSEDNTGKTPVPPPSPNTDTNNLVYLSQGILTFPSGHCNTKFKFNEYTISIKETFKEIPNPPPQNYS